MTVLVTGGAGFIGSHLITALVKRYPNEKIISVDNYFTGSPKNHIKHKKVKYIKADTKNIFSVWKKYRLPKPRVIFHLGEYSRIVQSFEDFDILWEFNISGTKEIIKFAGKIGAKLLYAGSSSKFGNQGEDENLSPYSWVKAKNIELIKNYANWYGLEYVITYFYNVYGPGQLRKGKYATVIGIFEKKFIEGKPLTIVSPGTQTRDFTHVDDIVEGIIVCSEKGKGDGYQLGTGVETSIKKLANLFNTDSVLVPERKGERKNGKAKYTEVKKLGWNPTVRLEDYIRQFVEKNR